MCAASLAHLVIFGSRSRVILWAYPHPFYLVEKVGPSEPNITCLFFMKSGNVIIVWDM